MGKNRKSAKDTKPMLRERKREREKERERERKRERERERERKNPSDQAPCDTPPTVMASFWM
jgi:hypothetical protein